MGFAITQQLPRRETARNRDVRLSFSDSVYTGLSQHLEPYRYTADLYGSLKRSEHLRISSYDTAPPFEMEKSIFHKVPYSVKTLIIATLYLTIPFWGNNNFATCLNGFIYNLIDVISAIRQQTLSGNTVN